MNLLYAAPDTKPIIYGLVDPAEPERVRYVGQTTHPYMRYVGHVLSRKYGRAGFGPLARWVRVLYLNHDRVPSMILLEALADPKDLRRRERVWIGRLAALGQADLNRSNAGRAIVPESYFSESDEGVSA